jgi:hypothetical protein
MAVGSNAGGYFRFPPVIASEAKQSSSDGRCDMDCFASLAMTGI